MNISLTLSAIERQAAWVIHHAKQARNYVNQLSARRSFESKAEAALQDAERELLSALEVVREAQKQFAAKPINDKAA